jgi:hypothetical protein
MVSAEIGERVHQPPRRKGRLGADRDFAGRASTGKGIKTFADVVKGTRENSKQTGTFCRQPDLAVLALEERMAQQGLQLTYLAANGRLAHEQLFSGQRHALQPSRRLEAAQGCQWQATALHSHNLMSIKGTK